MSVLVAERSDGRAGRDRGYLVDVEIFDSIARLDGKQITLGRNEIRLVRPESLAPSLSLRPREPDVQSPEIGA